MPYGLEDLAPEGWFDRSQSLPNYKAGEITQKRGGFMFNNQVSEDVLNFTRLKIAADDEDSMLDDMKGLRKAIQWAVELIEKLPPANEERQDCDVFMGLCGAYNEGQLGKCDIYSDGICHNWIESDIRDRIAHCGHRNRMRDKTLRKAICDSLQQTKCSARDG